jgi:isocitrate dehydrogenase kinase/phosphatase
MLVKAALNTLFLKSRKKMFDNEIKKSLIKIEILWENISNESSDDLDAYDFISVQTMTLQMATLQLQDAIEDKIRRDKRDKLKFQKLHRALSNILKNLNFKLQMYEQKEDIEYILQKLSEITDDIEVVKQYQ